jgi:hypothetical protein
MDRERHTHIFIQTIKHIQYACPPIRCIGLLCQRKADEFVGNPLFHPAPTNQKAAAKLEPAQQRRTGRPVGVSVNLLQ